MTTMTVHMSPQGRVVVPAPLRNTLGITPDTDLAVYLEDGRVVYERRSDLKKRLQAEASAAFQSSGISPVQELAAERRAEAAEEAEQ